MSNYIPVCSCCGCVPVRSLKSTLNDLLLTHPLYELGDRLVELVDDQAHLTQNEDCREEWDQLVILLEQVTARSLKLAAIKRKQAEPLWE